MLGTIAIVPVAIVLGTIALVQVRRSGDRGRGMAIAGIAVSVVWTVVAIGGVLLLIDNLVERDETGRIVQAGLLDELDLRPGDCVNEPAEDALLLHAVPCDEPHDTEVFARVRLKGGGWPGSDNIRRRAHAACAHRIGLDDLRLIDDVSFFSPDRFDWLIDDHDVICFAHFEPRRRGPLDPDEPVEGLLSGAPAAGVAGVT